MVAFIGYSLDNCPYPRYNSVNTNLFIGACFCKCLYDNKFYRLEEAFLLHAVLLNITLKNI